MRRTKILKIAIHLVVQLKRVALGADVISPSSKGSTRVPLLLPLFSFRISFLSKMCVCPFFYRDFFSWRLFTWRYFFPAWLNFASSADVVAPRPGQLPRTAITKARTLPALTAPKHVGKVQYKQL